MHHGRNGAAALATLLTTLLVAAGAGSAPAATTTWQPQPAAARSFPADAAGWSAALTYEGGGLTCAGILKIDGVTCPAVTTGWHADAGDGHLRTTAATLVGLLSTSVVTWTSPTFTLGARPDLANFGFELRGGTGSLLTLGRTTVTATLADLTDGSHSVVVSPESAVAGSATFNAYGGALSPALLQPGHRYAVKIALRVATPVGLAVNGAIDVDDVALELVDLDPPTGLTAALAADTVGVRVTGAVDPHGQATTVTADYGLTTAYGASTSTAVSGSGAQAYSLPLAGLTPGARYHLRVTARSPDGAVTTGDQTFDAPAQPASDGAPMLVGASGSRQRIAVFDLDVAVTRAVVQVRDGADSTVLDSFVDNDLDGSATIALPDQAGDYNVRVVRTRSGGPTPSPSVATTYDPTPPDSSDALVIVVPWSSADRTRAVTVLGTPDDAVSATLQVLDGAEQPVGAPVVLRADGTASVTLPAQPGGYRVRATFVNGAGISATARSLPLVLTEAAPGGDPGRGGGDPGNGGTGGGGNGDGARAAGDPPSRLPLTVPQALDPRRRLVGRIAPRTVTVGGLRVRIAATVPRTIAGSAAIRFRLTQRGRGRLKAVRWTLDGRALRGAAVAATLLRADGRVQTVAVRLVPSRGRAVTVRFRIRTRAA